MNKTLTAVIVIIALALLLSLTPLPSIATDAATAAARVVRVYVVNWPDVQKTAEQNVDANGDIKVHEQGEVTVNGAVDVSNLPLDGQGNVKVSETADTSPQVVTLLDNVETEPGVWSTPVSTAGYRHVSLLAKTTSLSHNVSMFYETATGEKIHAVSYIVSYEQGIYLNTSGLTTSDPAMITARIATQKMEVFGPYLTIWANCKSTPPCGRLTVKAYLSR